MTFSDFTSLMSLTFRNPPVVAERLRALDLSLSDRITALAIVVTISSVIAYLSGVLVGGVGDAQGMMVIAGSPIVMALAQLTALLLAVILMTYVGRMFGGQGSFADGLLFASWIEAVLLSVQLVQLVLFLTIPALAGFLGLLSIALFFWLIVQFTKALHGFKNGFKVLMAMIGTMIATGFILSFILAAFGIMPQVPQ